VQSQELTRMQPNNQTNQSYDNLADEAGKGSKVLVEETKISLLRVFFALSLFSAILLTLILLAYAGEPRIMNPTLCSDVFQGASFPIQPVSSWSNMIFSLFGFLALFVSPTVMLPNVFCIKTTNRETAAKRILFGIVMISIGYGSFLFHATFDKVGR
jgi:hypothetical protein